jgi:uncharacterized protein (TIGR03435 family)
MVLPIWIGIIHASIMRTQSQALPDWETAAGGKMAFEVASIKLDKGPARSPLFPLDNGKRYTPGDPLSAAFPDLSYIQFAYKVRFSQRERDSILDHFPKWIGSDLYAIEAKAPASASKDQMRLMVQSLLAERFHLAVHFETQETAVLALKLVKPGQTGPKLHPHMEGTCDGDPGYVRTVDKSQPFPGKCYQTVVMPPNGQRLRAFARDITMAELAESLPSRLDLPVVDQTGLTGGIDFELEWITEPSPGATPDATASPDPELPTFLVALREQLGLKLESTRMPIRVLMIDRIDRPSEN